MNKIKSWFGYGLHLVADTQYEIPLAVQLTPATPSFGAGGATGDDSRVDAGETAGGRALPGLQY